VSPTPSEPASLIGASGILITLLLFGGIVAYFVRAAVGPIRRIAAATAQVSAGELGVEVPEAGAGEVGQLTTAFNEMSRSLAGQQQELAERNVELERLANVLRAVLDSTVDGILLSDAEGNVQLANRPVITLTRAFGMSFEGPVVDRLLSVQQRMADPDKYRAAMERPSDEPERADVRRVRGCADRARLSGVHRTCARRPWRLPRPDLDVARGDEGS